MTRIGINGFGRIGRSVFLTAPTRPRPRGGRESTICSRPARLGLPAEVRHGDEDRFGSGGAATTARPSTWAAGGTA